MPKGSIRQINLHQVQLKRGHLPRLFLIARDPSQGGASGLHPLFDHCQSVYEVGNFTRNINSDGEGINYIDGWQRHQQHGRGSRGDIHWGRDMNNQGTGGDNKHQGGDRGDRGGNGNTPKITHTQYRQWYGQNSSRDGDRLV